ncbi:hypothetical protein HAX54_045494, partial [Datura stramonium]|nr:hypothetical protein [Datura stramonium]
MGRKKRRDVRSLAVFPAMGRRRWRFGGCMCGWAVVVVVVRDVAAAKGDGRSSGGGGRLGGKIEKEMQLWCDGYLVTAGEEDEREREKRKGKGAAAAWLVAGKNGRGR